MRTGFYVHKIEICHIYQYVHYTAVKFCSAKLYQTSTTSILVDKSGYLRIYV